MRSDIEKVPLSISSIGTQRQLVLYRFGAGRPGPKIYLQAGLHADEPPGMVILHHVIKMLQERDGEPRGEIVIVPCANPIGLSQRIQGYHAGRSDLGVGGNFNRNFPDVSAPIVENISTLTTKGEVVDEAIVKLALRRAVAALVPKTELDSMKQTLLGHAIDADYVLDIHCDDEAVVYAYVSDPAHPAAKLFSRHIGSVVTIGGSYGPGTFKDSCFRPWRAAQEVLPNVSMTGCLAATLEYRGTRDVRDELAIADARGLISFMEATGVLDPSSAEHLENNSRHITLDCVDYIQADAPGIILFSKGPGDFIEAGEEVAQILDPSTGERTIVAARCSGIVFGHVASRIAVPGSSIASIAGTSPLPKEAGDPFP